jgi:hypothetical protein
MTAFAVVRYVDPSVGLGILPADAIPQARANGWTRVSEYRPEPSAFHLPDFVDAIADLDAEQHDPAESAQDEAATTTEPAPVEMADDIDETEEQA